MDDGAVDLDLKVTGRATLVHEAVDLNTSRELAQNELFRLIKLRRVVSATTELNVYDYSSGHAGKMEQNRVEPISG